MEISLRTGLAMEMPKPQIQIEQMIRNESGWSFVVQIGESSDEAKTFNVRLDDDYYEHLTKGKVDPEDLVEASFEFLLSREQTDSILSSFDLDSIGTYFDDYEAQVQEKIQGIKE